MTSVEFLAYLTEQAMIIDGVDRLVAEIAPNGVA